MGAPTIITDFKPIGKEPSAILPSGDLPEKTAWLERLIMAGGPDPHPANIDEMMNGVMPDRFKNDPATYGKEVAKSLNPLVRPFVAQGFNAMSALNRGFATMATHLDSISTYLAEKTGMEKTGVLGPDAVKKVADYYNKDANHWARRAQEVGINFIDELISEAVGGAMPGIAEFMLNIPYSALLGASEAYRKGESEIAGALVEGAKRGVLGAMFHALGPLKKYLQAPIMGGIFGVQAAVEGAAPREIAKSVGTGALYALTSPGGRLGLNDLQEDLIKSYVRMEAEKSKVEPIVGGPTGPQVKELWEMTKDEFSARAVYQGRPSGEASTQYWTQDLEQAKGHAEKQQKRPGVTKKSELVVADINNFGDETRQIEEGGIIKNLTIDEWKKKGISNLVEPSYPPSNIPVLGTIPLSAAKDPHKFLVEKAISEGKSVPPEVLKDYPELDTPKKAGKPTEPETLISWIRSKGGVNLEDYEGYSSKESGIVGLINKKGVGMDELTAQAIEEGWLTAGSTERDFVNLLDQDIRAVNRRVGQRAQRIGEERIPQGPEPTAEEKALVDRREQLMKKGFRLPDEPIAAGDLKKGDKVVIKDEEFIHKGFDKKGNAILGDGETLYLQPFDMIEADAVKIKQSLTRPMNVRERDALGLTENQARLLESIQQEDPARYAKILEGNTKAQVQEWEASRLEKAQKMRQPGIFEEGPLSKGGAANILETWIKEKAREFKGKVVDYDHQLKEVSALIRKGETPPELNAQQVMEILPRTFDRETGEWLGPDSQDWPRTGTLIDFIEGQEQNRMPSMMMAKEGEAWRRTPEKGGAARPTSRADILRFLQQKLDIPIRTGRFIERALGVFKPREKVIRSKRFADIEVIAHEVGHSIQEFLWPETLEGLTPTEKIEKYRTGEFERDKAFLPYREELTALASEPRPGQSRLAEGYAEFVRLYMTNEPLASGLAPKFYDYFDHLLEQKAPESRDVFMQVREMYNNYMRQPAYQRVRSQVSIGENNPRKTTLDDLYTMALDEFHPLKRTQAEILQGEKIPLGDRPYERARLLNGWIGKANSFLRHAAFRFNTLEDVGKSFQDILKPIAEKGDLEEFSTYMVAKRIPGLLDRGIDEGITREDANKVVQDLDPKYSKVFSDLEPYQEHLLKYLVEAGILSPDSYKKILTVSKDFDPFQKVFEESTGPSGGMGKGLQAYQPIKEIVGGWQRIQDPLESIIKNTMLYINLAERNAVGKSLVTLAQSHEAMGKFVEEIPVPMYGVEAGAKEIFSPQELEQLKKAGLEPREFYTIFRPNAFTPRENVISVWIAGERKDYQVEPDVYRTFRALDREGANAIEKLAAYPARWLRAGSVLTPEFLARNPFRDQFSAFIQSKYNFIPGLDLIRGVFHLMKQDETYWKWQKSGGTQATLASMDRDYFQEKMGEILKGYPILKLIKNPIEGLRVLGEIGEVGTRLGEFAKGLKAEGETKAGIEAAGYSSREVTTDFQRIGAKTRAVNSIISFWNANNQGIDRMVRAFQENPASATIKAMAAITLPSVLLAWANHDDPRYWEIPQWQRDLCWIVFPNHMTKETWEAMSPEEKSAEVRLFTGAAWRFPKPWEIGILFGSIPERITHYILKNDPEAFSKIGESAWRTISPGVIPTFLVPWLENQANYSFFFDRNIVPGDRKDLPPEYQYGPWTTPAAKALGETLGRLPYIDKTQFASPAKVENLIRGWTGGLGYYALQLAGAALQYTGRIEEGPPQPTKSFADIPFIKAFAVRYPTTSAESIQEFYERYKEASGIARAIEVTAKEYRFEKSIKLLVEDYAGNLEGHHQTMSNLQKMVELVYNNPDMTPDEKREFVDICYFQMIDVAHNGVQMIKELKGILKEDRKEATRPAEPIKARKPAPPPAKAPRSVEFEGR
jgi:hypothetical protein